MPSKVFYTVQAIIGKRFNKKNKSVQYKVKWVGYPLSEATWEPIQHLAYVEDQIDAYNKKQSKCRKTTSVKKRQRESNKILEDKQNKSQQISKSQNQSLFQDDDSESWSKGIIEKLSKRKTITKIQNKASIKAKTHSKNKKIGKTEQKQQNIEQNQIQKQEELELQQSSSNFNTPLPQYVYDMNQRDQQEGLVYQLLNAADQNQNITTQPQLFQQKNNFIIEGMKRNGSDYIYYVNDEGIPKIISRSEILRNHKLALCKFYEANIHFEELDQGSKEEVAGK